MNDSANIRKLIKECVIVCPDCCGSLRAIVPARLSCTECGHEYQSTNDVPILLNRASAFSHEQVTLAQGTYFAQSQQENRLKRRMRRSLPSLARDFGVKSADRVAQIELHKKGKHLTGLVVGAGEKSEAISRRFPQVVWVSTDVDLAYGPNLIADSTGLPFATASVDVVVAEMVLEHVIDIGKASAELQRVCKTGGIILITVPFCFPWHGIPYDFYRLTPSGVRALFSSSDVIYMNKCMGSWGALAYQLDSLVVNTTSRRYVRMALALVSRFLFGWLKYLDLVPSSRMRGMISTAGIVFIGRKRSSALSAREIVSELRSMFDADKAL